ncbi:hypothetical protein N7462_007620 [Penicillium macrosclerotiorum]|uniref:uncharacterized protein n=1 Tax=Penicillium macrosclerotiorum TaxID=303699 RepID=UPI002547AF45|nr:uncharacterized protein N7462_007620 [Penicillium macrosclerotiorum]KAJ5679376.1 hypothetical protein N7462_007620 [Penicillium macrosclerotiorum]
MNKAVEQRIQRVTSGGGKANRRNFCTLTQVPAAGEQPDLPWVFVMVPRVTTSGFLLGPDFARGSRLSVGFAALEDQRTGGFDNWTTRRLDDSGADNPRNAASVRSLPVPTRVGPEERNPGSSPGLVTLEYGASSVEPVGAGWKSEAAVSVLGHIILRSLPVDGSASPVAALWISQELPSGEGVSGVSSFEGLEVQLYSGVYFHKFQSWATTELIGSNPSACSAFAPEPFPRPGECEPVHRDKSQQTRNCRLGNLAIHRTPASELTGQHDRLSTHKEEQDDQVQPISSERGAACPMHH